MHRADGGAVRTPDIAVKNVAFERLYNFRDVGGYRAHGGRAVARQCYYRSDSLGKLAGGDLDRFAELGVRTVLDLRYPWEIEANGRMPELAGIGWFNFSIEHRSYDQARVDASVDPSRFLADRHAEVALDGKAELRSALETIADQPGPVVVHCTAGKDRTGLLTAIVLSLIGVGEDDIVADYALTNLATPHFLADWYVRNTQAPWRGWGRAPEGAMRLFLSDMRLTYGGLPGYARTVLGVDDSLVAILRDRLLEPRPD